MNVSAVDLFAGIGWGFACQELGIDEYGIDNEPTVQSTRDLLGMPGKTADILDLDPLDFAGVEGIIASPPCQSWSRAGNGLGLDDPRGQLVWQPLVWALAIRPRWVVCEQVPEARGAYEQIAHQLRDVGYHTDVYTISAETFGVPQARMRVFLVAHRDRAPMRPRQTHQRFRKGRPRVEPCDMLGLLPWVSMAEALDVGFLRRPSLTIRGHSETGSGHGMITEAIAQGQWKMEYHRGAGMTERYGERPGRCLGEPSFCLTTGPATWRSAARTASAVPIEQAGDVTSVALTETQACALMGFPPHAHSALQGNKANRWRLIGNAVCPPVAVAVLRSVLNESDAA